MPERVYRGPHVDGCRVSIPGEDRSLIFPNREEALEVTAEQAAALDTTGEFTEPAKKKAAPKATKPKATKADTDTSEED